MDVNVSNVVKSISVATNVTAPKVETKSSPKVTQSNTNTAKNLQDIIRADNFEQAYFTTSEKAVLNAVNHINKVVQGANVQLEYSFHKATGSTIIKMINKDTNEVIKEIPPEKTLDLFVEKMKILGLYIDEKG